MVEGRPPIAAEIRRRVLVDAGHRCSIPTCRHIDVEIHHIIPWTEGQAHDYENLIALCPNCHRRADAGDIDRKSLRLYKLNLRFAHDKFSQLEMDVLFELYALDEKKGVFWPPYLLILLKRILESGFLEVERPPKAVTTGGMRINPDTLTLSKKGRQFLDELGIKEL